MPIPDVADGPRPTVAQLHYHVGQKQPLLPVTPSGTTNSAITTVLVANATPIITTSSVDANISVNASIVVNGNGPSLAVDADDVGSHGFSWYVCSVIAQ